jgi:hypothetical protein
MACGRDSFRPKIVVGLVFHHHGSSGFDQGSILPFGDPILLGSIWRGVLMLDSFFAEEVIQGVVLELCTIIAPYCENRGVVLALNLSGKLHHGMLSLTLALEEEYPAISRVVADDDEAILLPFKTFMIR